MVAVVVEVELGVGSYSVSSTIVVSRIGPGTYFSFRGIIGPGRCAGQTLCTGDLENYCEAPTPQNPGHSHPIRSAEDGIEPVWPITFPDLNLENYCYTVPLGLASGTMYY